MITVYRNLDYEDFYRLIADCDIVVPAFSSFLCESGYRGPVKFRVSHIFDTIDYEQMASSTVALAVELNVSSLQLA